jgi:hypothetical protein
MRFCVLVKNQPCVVCIIIMRLISWNRSHGSETLILTDCDVTMKTSGWPVVPEKGFVRHKVEVSLAHNLTVPGHKSTNQTVSSIFWPLHN